MIDRGHPAPEPADADDERLDERRRAVGLDRGEELHDLEVLAAAAVGRQERGPAPALTVMPDRPVLDRAPCRRSTAAARTADLDRRLVAAAAPGSPRSRSRTIQASAVCSRSNSLTWISPWRAVDFQWIRLKRRPGAYGRTVVASGVVCSVRSGVAWLPSRLAAGSRQQRQRLEPRVDDHVDRPARPSPTTRRTRTGRRSGCGAARSGSGRAGSAARGSSHERSLAAAERDRPARAGRRAASSGCGPRARASGAARVAERVGHPDPVADVAVELADRVARLEVGQPEAGQDVASRRRRGSPR